MTPREDELRRMGRAELLDEIERLEALEVVLRQVISTSIAIGLEKVEAIRTEVDTILTFALGETSGYCARTCEEILKKIARIEALP